MPNTSQTHEPAKKTAPQTQQGKGGEQPNTGASPDTPNQEPNEGEGSRTGARQYDAATEKYIQSGRVEKAAKEAKRAVEGPEGEELRAAEREGRGRAKGDDD
ncbi:hypothetical protein LZC95_49535 [Pendulispora brunnea]|uniref:Uncharacterized protein n=1 Tax=Pendulispora brunnea TaxID=2905690 RepID=A0ABZ2KAU3_9BACT